MIGEAGPPFLLRVQRRSVAPHEGYPFDLVAVRHLDEIPFRAVTLLVGDNGTGKSTLTEALAVAAGFNAEGGGRNLSFGTVSTHSALHEQIELVWRRRPTWGWFLRAETFYGMASHIQTDEDLQRIFPRFHHESHGESFLDLAMTRFRSAGFYILDEPEAALSLQGQLKLLRIIFDSVEAGAQYVIATHSPILMAFPGAAIVELTEDGSQLPDYAGLEVVQLWRQFLESPESFLRHLFA